MSLYGLLTLVIYFYWLATALMVAVAVVAIIHDLYIWLKQLRRFRDFPRAKIIRQLQPVVCTVDTCVGGSYCYYWRHHVGGQSTKIE